MTAKALLTPSHAVIGANLAKSAVATRQVGPQAWTAVLPTGTRLSARADRGVGWLVLETSPVGHMVASHTSPSWWRWLEWSGRLAGPVKLVLRPGSWSRSLRADIPLDEETDIAMQVREACWSALVMGERDLAEALAGDDDFTGAIAGLLDARPGANVFEPPLPPKSDALTDSAALCAEAGWAFAEPNGSTLRVDLGVAAQQTPARVEQGLDGRVRAHVDMVRRDAGGLSAASRDALAVFALTASAVVRLARAYVDRSADDMEVGFEVRSGESPKSGELGHALSSLSVACALFGREAQALAHDRIARAYLAMRGRADGAAAQMCGVAAVSGRRWRVGYQ